MIKVIISILLLFSCLHPLTGQKKTIYCIKQSYYHLNEDGNDSSQSKFLRTVWFDMCNGTTSISKSWQFRRNRECNLQMLSYTNQIQKQSFDITWKEKDTSNEEFYTFHSISYDSISHKYHTFHAFVPENDTIQVDFEKWRIEKDSVIKEIFRVDNSERILSELQNWMINDRALNDSLSVPNFPILDDLRLTLLQVKKSEVQPGQINFFEPHASGFECGEEKPKKYIRKNSKRINISRNGLFERRFHRENDIETIIDIYYVDHSRIAD
jgi:hypothetical protein